MGSDLGGTPLFRERVLVVEDDKAIRALISTTLERQEVEPCTRFHRTSRSGRSRTQQSLRHAA